MGEGVLSGDQGVGGISDELRLGCDP